jgi:serine/threonine protein kinase
VDIGSRIGPYEVISLLGRGGMGRVYLARDPRLNRTVAVKVLSIEHTDHPEAQERLRREVLKVQLPPGPPQLHVVAQLDPRLA